MHIVTDSGTDLNMVSEGATDPDVTIVPLVVTLQGKSYREGIDITPDEFYHLLAETTELPVTSQPSAGDFAEVYRRLAATDPDILSIHMSSGLSGTCNAARAGAAMVPEAHVVQVDTKTLSIGSGWQVEAAVRAVKKGWPVNMILDLIAKVREATETVYTLEELKYLIHGGRISHMKGLIASILNIKPVIGVEKVKGTYVQMGQARAFKGALDKIVELMTKQHPEGSSLRVQVVFAHYEEGAALLRERIEQVFECTWLPAGPISLVLGAHTGPSLVGVAYAAQSLFANLA